MAGQELPVWIQLLGIVGYAMSVSLAVLGVGIGIAFIQSGESKRVWLLFIAGMLGYTIMFSNLVFIATDPLTNRLLLTIVQRLTAIIAASLIWAYAILAMRDRWRREKRQ